MIELDPSRYDAVRPLFPDLQFYPHLPFCVLERRQPGWVFVDDSDEPSAALVCHRIGYSYVAGRNESFAAWVGEQALNAVTCDALYLCSADEFWHERIPSLPGCQIDVLRVRSYRLDELAFHQARQGLPEEPASCRLEPITTDMIATVQGLSCLAFFETAETFAADGLGCVMLEGNELASSCVTSFVGDGTCDASLVTREAYRRKGHATLVSAAFIAGCLARGWEPIWHAEDSNVASNRIAKKLGYEQLGTFSQYKVRAAS